MPTKQSEQPAPEGRLRVVKGGILRRVSDTDAQVMPDVAPGERFVTATLRGDVVDVRVGATATRDGLLVNREFTVDDPAALEEVRTVLAALLDEVGDAVEQLALRDAENVVFDIGEGGRP